MFECLQIGFKHTRSLDYFHYFYSLVFTVKDPACLEYNFYDLFNETSVLYVNIKFKLFINGTCGLQPFSEFFCDIFSQYMHLCPLMYGCSKMEVMDQQL